MPLWLIRKRRHFRLPYTPRIRNWSNLFCFASRGQQTSRFYSQWESELLVQSGALLRHCDLCKTDRAFTPARCIFAFVCSFILTSHGFRDYLLQERNKRLSASTMILTFLPYKPLRPIRNDESKSESEFFLVVFYFRFCFSSVWMYP